MLSPTLLTAHEFTSLHRRVGFADTIVLGSADSRWLAGRKLIHKHFGSAGLMQYHQVMTLEAHRLAHELLEGNSFNAATQRYACSHTPKHVC